MEDRLLIQMRNCNINHKVVAITNKITKTTESNSFIIRFDKSRVWRFEILARIVTVNTRSQLYLVGNKSIPNCIPFISLE